MLFGPQRVRWCGGRSSAILPAGSAPWRIDSLACREGENMSSCMRHLAVSFAAVSLACASSYYDDPVGGSDAGTWVNATANLAGMQSECGNMGVIGAHPGRDMLVTGVALRGLFGSADSATTWSPLGNASGSAVITN